MSETLTVEEAAERLGIGRELAYKLAGDGSLPGVIRLGRRIMVSRAALEDVLTHGQRPKARPKSARRTRYRRRGPIPSTAVVEAIPLPVVKRPDDV